MKKVIIFGGTGFIGKSLAVFLNNQNYKVTIVGRSAVTLPNIESVLWDAKTLGTWKEKLEHVDIIVNLAGKSVNCIKSPEHVDEILKSRIETTKLIGKAVQLSARPPKVWIQMATAHIYGDSETRTCDENSSTGYGLAPFVGNQWEKAFNTSCPSSIRKVILRTSIVIGKNGGALQTFKKIIRLGFGGKIGNGKQGISWIHEFDLHNFIQQSIENRFYKGIYNLSSPNPVSNKEFLKSLRKTMKVPFGIPNPTLLVKFGSKYLLKTDAELAIYGRYVHSHRIEESFFRYPDLKLALQDLCRKEV